MLKTITIRLSKTKWRGNKLCYLHGLATSCFIVFPSSIPVWPSLLGRGEAGFTVGILFVVLFAVVLNKDHLNYLFDFVGCML